MHTLNNRYATKSFTRGMIVNTDAVTVWKLSSTAVAVLISSLRDWMIRSETSLYPKTQNGRDPKRDCSLIETAEYLVTIRYVDAMRLLCRWPHVLR